MKNGTPVVVAGNSCMSKAEHARRSILELIASDPNGDWNVHQICERIYGHSDRKKGSAVRRALRNMRLPGTWRLGWRNSAMRLYDPCSDARLTDLQKRIEHLEKKGWHENAKACAEELKRLRALKGLPPE
jgi:hypothetical protein